MTWQSPNNRIDYYLSIAGIGVFGTIDATPTGSWFTSEFSSGDYNAWLVWEITDLNEEVAFQEGTLRCDSITVTIMNPDGALLSMLRGSSRVYTYGLETLTTTGTSLTVENNAGWATSGSVYIGQERLSYSALSGSTGFSGLSRGQLGTIAEEHFYSAADVPESTYRVSSYPITLKGRRAILYARESDGTETPVYRGYVSTGTRWGRGFAEVKIDHISSFIEKKMGSGLRRIRVYRGGQFTENSPNTETILQEVHGGAAVTTTISTRRWSEFEDETQANLSMGGLERDFDGDKNKIKSMASVPAAALNTTVIQFSRGSFLWTKGFEDGSYAWTGGGDRFMTAQNDEVPFYDDWSADPIIWTAQAPSKTMDLVVGRWYSYDENPAVQVRVVSTATNSVYLSQASLDLGRNGGDNFLSQVEEDSDSTTVREAVVFYDSLADAIRRALGHLSGQPEAARWLLTGVTTDDIDYLELSTVAAQVSPALSRVDYQLVESEKLEEILTPHLALCGIAPRVIADGKIGFARVHQPVETEAAQIVVDEETWALIEAREAEAREDDVPIVTGAKIQYGRSHVGDEAEEKGDEWQSTLKLVWREGVDASGDENVIGLTIPGLRRPLSRDPVDFDQEINTQVVATHFAIYGFPAAVVEIPCTWSVRSIYCGDVVTVTHPLAPDIVEGDIGLASKLGIVVGRRLRLTSPGPDMLAVLFPETTGGTGIAPAAHGTAYVASTAVITCSAAADGAYGSPNDLSAFAAIIAAQGSDAKVRFTTYDSSSPTVWTGGASSISVSTGTMSLSFDVFSTAFPGDGVWITLRDWDDVGTEEKKYAYQADAATNPTLGTGADSPKRWTI